MIIGIEAERANSGQKTGVEHYAQQLILQFAEIDKENQYVLYLRTQPQEWILQLPKNFSYKVMPFPLFWTQIRLSWEMLRHSPDVLFVPASSMPLVHPRKTVVTVHDLAFMLYPETYTSFMRYYHMFEDVLVSRLAWRVIAVSESTKRDFVNFWQADEKRVTVVHHGYTPQKSHIVIPDSTSESSNTGNLESTTNAMMDSGLPVSQSRGLELVETGMTRSKMILPEKFVLFLSTLQPRKNLHGLIAACKEYRLQHPTEDLKLVVAGRVGWKSEEIVAEIEANKDFVVYLNHVIDADRATLYQRASAFCVPSFYEGFGMWILEAFDAGVPVATSNVSSMPEVAGDAAEYCDPHDVASIASALTRVLQDKERAALLVQKGRERLQEFSWGKCAKDTLATLTAQE